MLVRQSRAGERYSLVDPPKDTETLHDGYFVPAVAPTNRAEAKLDVVERMPSN